MLKVRQILVTTIVLAASTVVLSGCGQKGPLILPPPTTTTAPKPAPAAPGPLIPAPAASSTQ